VATLLSPGNGGREKIIDQSWDKYYKNQTLWRSAAGTAGEQADSLRLSI